MQTLSSKDREFFSQVAQSAMLNPFSAERLTSDASAVGKKWAAGSFAHLDELLAKLETRIRANSPTDGKPLLRAFPAEDTETLEFAVLFLVFHNYRESLDAYIRAQGAELNSLLPADCAAAIFANLLTYGFTVAKAERCVAIFFQMRRAFLFISTGLVGDCESMRGLRIDLWNAIFTSDRSLYLDRLWNRMENFSTLLIGETGTGKGAAAAAMGRAGYIPYNSARRAFSENFTSAFLSINLSEFAENLIESELFGHKKGAFTGAVGDHDGIFSRCSRHGAIFLDEIGDVSLQVQIKLLQVLQQRFFSPVGGYEKLRFSGRIIAATNQDLAKRRADGLFRNDFYYRLSSSHIELPSLRQRISENPAERGIMVAETVKRLTGADDAPLVARIEEALERDLPPDYSWPGNVRELEQAARSVILTGGYRGEAPTLPAPLRGDARFARFAAGDMTLSELEAWYCSTLYSKLGTYGAVAKKLGTDWRTAKLKIAAAARATTPKDKP